MVTKCLALEVFQPFTPVVDMLWIICFWAMKKAMSTGITAITEPAIKRSGRIRRPVTAVRESRSMPNGRVKFSVVCNISSGHMKEFQWAKNVKTPRVARTGLERGRMILQYISRCEAPSTLAPSINSLGIAKTNWRIRKTPKGEARKGMIKA